MYRSFSSKKKKKNCVIKLSTHNSVTNIYRVHYYYLPRYNRVNKWSVVDTTKWIKTFQKMQSARSCSGIVYQFYSLHRLFLVAIILFSLKGVVFSKTCIGVVQLAVVSKVNEVRQSSSTSSVYKANNNAIENDCSFVFFKTRFLRFLKFSNIYI